MTWPDPPELVITSFMELVPVFLIPVSTPVVPVAVLLSVQSARAVAVSNPAFAM